MKKPMFGKGGSMKKGSSGKMSVLPNKVGKRSGSMAKGLAGPNKSQGDY